MAYTEPAGVIKLLTGTPFTADYKYSIAFSSLEAQLSYMNSMVDENCVFTEQNYVKAETGKIRVHKQEEHVRDCNYMMWKTPSIDGIETYPSYTWMFAFITDINYISNAVTEITYEIDVLQTYALFNVDFKDCYIERMHTHTDNIGDHLEPEPVSFSEYKQKLIGNLYEDASGYDWLVYAPFDFPYDTTAIADEGIRTRLKSCPSMGVKCGLYQGLICTVFESTTLLNTFTATLPEDIASLIVAIVGVPKGFVTGEGSGYPARLSDQSNYKQDSNIAVTFPSSIDGHPIKNNKLYTFPFYSLLISDGEGNENTYRWEYFKTREIGGNPAVRFQCVLAIQPNPEMAVIPEGYGGLSLSEQNYNEKIVLSNFPHAPWIGNTFSTWCATQGVVSAVSGIMGTLTNLATGSFVNAGVNALHSGVNFAIGMQQAMRKPNNAHGAAGGDAMLAGGYKTVRAYRQFINKNDLERIDDFFTRFGYAINRIGNPKTNSIAGSASQSAFTNGRLHQHYIKTQGCLVLGRCASEYARRIETIFDNGITWWSSPNVVGEYN